MTKQSKKLILLESSLSSVVLTLVLCTINASALALDRAHTLNIYAWSDYFPKSLIDKFQTSSGIHVNLALLDSPGMAETVLSAGHSNYDIVTMNASPELGREIPKGFWRKLDNTHIPNARNADKQILGLLQTVDPGNQYAIPWMWGTIGMMYNRDKLKILAPNAPLDSLDLLFKKEWLSKVSGCGVNLLDVWGEFMPMVSRYLAQPRLSTDPVALAAVVEKLKEIRPFIRRIASSGYYEQLADGELCLSIGYSGDAIIARRMVTEGHTDLHIEYSYAKETVPFFIDSLVIPADSPNSSGAEAFINFVMQPEISAEVTRYIGFATGNATAMQLLAPAIRDNPIIYPPASVRDRMTLQPKYTPAEILVFSRIWQQFKANMLTSSTTH